MRTCSILRPYATCSCGLRVRGWSHLADFPAAACAEHGIEPVHPDAFVLRLIDDDAAAVLEAMREHRGSLSRPPMTPDAYLENLARVGLPKTAERMKIHAAEL